MEKIDEQKLAELLAAELTRHEIGSRVKRAIEECMPDRYCRSAIKDVVEKHVCKVAEKIINDEFREKITKRVQEMLTPLLVDQTVQNVIGKMISQLYRD